MTSTAVKITGHVRVEERKGARVWVAKFMRAEGAPTRKVLGPAWAKDTGRKTARGATIWRAADGAKPDGYLTPKEAEEELRRLLDAERSKPAAKGPRKAAGHTFAEACRAWLSYLQNDKGREVTTMRRYRGIVDQRLLPTFGESTPVRRVTSERIEDWRTELLAGDLSRDTVRQYLTALSGVLKLAHRKGWVASDPMVNVERITTPKATGDFNVLQPSQVEAVARAAEADWQPVEAGEANRTRVTEEQAQAWTEARRWNALLYSIAILVAAYTGLRIGELRALRWRDIDWGGRVLHVRSNLPTSAPKGTKIKAPKSGKVRSVPLSDHAMAALDRLSRRDRFTGPDDLVFALATGEMMDGGEVRDAFYRALVVAGLGHLREKEGPMTFHDLRHSFGTLAVQVFPLTDVQAMMGHADISTTMRYVHYVPRHDAARRLSEAFAADFADVEQAAAAVPAVE